MSIPPIRVMVVDDEALVRDAVGVLLGLEDGIEVVATCGSAVDALQVSDVDVAVLDLQMPDTDGIELAMQLPEHVRTVIVTSHGRPGYLTRALESGVSGFLPKTASAGRFAEAVRVVADGGRYVDPDLAAEAMRAGDCPLTPRECDVLELSASGAPIGEVAARAFLSPGTVRNYLSAAMVKLGAANRHEAVQIAQRYGWI
ncbi:MAG: response regulator [Cumulibacter sp.]